MANTPHLSASLVRYLAVSFVCLFSGFPSAAAGVTPVLQNCRVAGTNFLFDLAAWPGDYIIEASANTAGAWIPEMTITVGRAGVVNVAIPYTGQKALLFRARGATPSDGVGCLAQFQTLGSTFEPEVGCDNGLPQQFQWIWSEGTTSTDYPVASIDFGTEGARVQGLLANPMTSVTSINLGFDGSDGGGNTPLSYRLPQNVSAVRFPYPLPGLRYWASSYNPITNTLDFSGFTNLEIIECYWCTNLEHVVVSNLPALKRACFERCHLQELDLSGNPNLEDLRGALNAYTNIVVGRGTGPMIWHWCTGNNPQLTQQFADLMTNFYSLQQLLIWNDNQRGTLALVSTNVTDLEAPFNFYTSADLAGLESLVYCDLRSNQLTNLLMNGCTSLQYLDVGDNQLTSLLLTGCQALAYLDAHGNLFATNMLDELLAFLDSSAPGLTNVDLTSNAQFPSPIGYSHYASLTNRGVRAFVDWPNTNNIPGGTNAITFVTVNQTTQMEIETDYGTPASILWHWGDGTVTSNSLTPDHDFGKTARFTNYVAVIPPGSVSYFGVRRGLANEGIEGVYGVANFPNLTFLYLAYESLTRLSLTGCSNLVQLHLAGNPVPATVCDQWFIDLDSAVPGPVTSADFWYPAASRSSASDAAWTNLVGKGYVMHPL